MCLLRQIRYHFTSEHHFGFEAAAYLRRCGVDIIRVKKWFQSDLASFNVIADIVKKAEITNGSIAISSYDQVEKDASLICAKAAYEITSDEIEFIKKNILHLVVALDRELAIKKQEEASVAIEKEKFKNSILRSLSHDLKTPLTSIKSGSDLILESYDELDDASKKEIVKDIYLEACDLHTFIVNLLNMTKLDQGKLLANRKYEPVDDILAGVYSKASLEHMESDRKSVV